MTLANPQKPAAQARGMGPIPLRAGAEALAQSLPALLAQAQLLANALAHGAHGRAKAGRGDEFWQYRPALPGDSAAMIDWRRSAGADHLFVRQREWQAQNHVALWADGAASLHYSSGKSWPTKAVRAQVLTLALAMLLLRGGEKVGLIGGLPAKSGRGHVTLLAQELLQTANPPDENDSGAAPPDSAPRAARMVYMSDFLGPIEATTAAVQRAAAQGAKGLLLQILDPSEISFPFAGRTVFLSMGGDLRHDTQNAADLRADYQRRLAQRQDDLDRLTRRLGWQYRLHVTDQPPISALIWAYHHLEKSA